MLPNITSKTPNKFISTHTDVNKTHLSISLSLPVIQSSAFNISEIIPLPINENNTLYMMDIPITKFFQNRTSYKVFPDNNTMDLLCKSQDKMTICNTLFDEYTETTSTCLQNLLTKNSDEGCLYKKIPYKNYFIQLSNELIYIFLTHPIKVVMNCKSYMYTVNLQNSTIMSVPNECNIYKYTDKNFNGNINNHEIIPQHKIISEINFSNRNESKKLSFLPIHDKHDLYLIESSEKIMRLKKELPLQNEKIDQIIKEDTKQNNLIPGINIYDVVEAVTKVILMTILFTITFIVIDQLLLLCIKACSK